MTELKMDQLTGEEIVISGISGCFPKAENTHQLSENLYNKVDMVTVRDEFAHIKHAEFPKYKGTLKGLEKFDAQFFRVTHWQAETLEPLGRKVMEQAFSAFFDAGINPETLKGTKLGVFIASMQADASSLNLYTSVKQNSFVISGCSKTMLANRVSYWLDGKGTSFGFDSGCSGSSAALEMAYNRIKNGEIDCALVGACNLCIHPVLDIQMRRKGLLCLDGKTKCFDKNGDGFVRSDAINVYFLQKAKDAKRIYSEIYHVKGKYFATSDGSFSLTHNPDDIETFLKEFYSEANVSPKDVEYIEANGFGVAEADEKELDAIGRVFGKDKTVKVGSIKSNMGNTEAVSGACSVTKMCLAYQKGQLPANLHYSNPQDRVSAVKEGKIQVVTENAPFNRRFTAINNFCYTGSNFHTLMKGHFKPKDIERYKSAIPRLVLISGRQEENVYKMLDILENNPIDPEQYALLNNFYKHNTPGYTGRGYTILDTDANKRTVRLARGFEYYSGMSRPLWFLYSGMGSQWAGMGEGLLRLPIFAAAIEKCHNVLQPKGLDIYKIIKDKDDGNMNIVNSLVGITAIQIGLTDVIKSLGIHPDYVIGHSVGELGSAYADGSLTAEETIMASYCRAIVSYETPFIKGMMAAIGLGHKEVDKLRPPEIEIACHNSPESSTISGPAEAVEKFVKSLTDQGIFAKAVASSNIAFHSRYIAEAGPIMLNMLKEFIKVPKFRSKKWYSTCYLPEDWHKPESHYASAEYFTHNLMGSVLFEEAAALIPDDAIILEIAPHGLLQAIMKRSHSQCLNMSLTRRGEKDSVKLLLETVGKLYQAGLNPDIEALYPKVEFPVSTETPLLSQFVGWDHRVDWNVEKFLIEESTISSSKEFILSVQDDDYTFFKNYTRNGSNILPEAAMLVFAWETLSEYNGVNYEDLSVVFDEVKFYNEVVLNPEEVLRLNITIQKGNSRFEIIHENGLISDGFISIRDNKNTKTNAKILFNTYERHLHQKDIYTLLRLKGYNYDKEFQSITSTNIEINKATIKWNENWIAFLDSIIQFNAMSKNHNGVSTVKLINKITINVDEHKELRSQIIEDIFYNAAVLDNVEDTICGGVIFKDIVFNNLPKADVIPILRTHRFVSHAPSHNLNYHTALEVNLQIISENVCNNLIRVKEITNKDNASKISTRLETLLQGMGLMKIKSETIDVRSYAKEYISDKSKIINTDVLILNDLLQYDRIIQETSKIINEDTFVLAVENKNIDEADLKTSLEIVTIMHASDQTLVLMKKPKQFNSSNTDIVTLENFETADTHKQKDQSENDKNVIIVAQQKSRVYDKRLLSDVLKNNKYYLFILEANSPLFKITSNYYKSQIQKGLRVNILEDGKWGSFVYTSESSKPSGEHNVILFTANELINNDSLVWVENPAIRNNLTVDVCYSGLSTRDYLKLSKHNENKFFGMDFSGIDARGCHVMGMLPHGALASTVEADCDLLWPVPRHWSLVEAATVPLPYVHAFYCLAMRCSLQKGRTILVIGAAGALGQALISVAQSLGCTIFATVSNLGKKKFLLKLFPQLDESNIGYTYDGTFRDMIMLRTKKKRCNVVINCGSGKIRELAMDCVGFNQYFLDLNESDQNENATFGMAYADEDRAYKSVYLSNIFNENNYKDKKNLQVMLSEGIAKGIVRPLTSVVYPPSDISKAFSLLANRSNRGRVLVNMTDPVVLKVNPRIVLSPSKTYVVVCDGSELGIELIDFLAQRGAKRLLVHCSPKSLSGYFHFKYSSWNKLGVTIEFSSDDLRTESGCQILLKNKNVDGIFVTINGLSANNDKINGKKCEHTALITSNLDLASRNCKKLRYFVAIITTSENLAIENYLEEIERCCAQRNELGAPALILRQTILNDTKLQPNTLSALFNALESSLKNKYMSVLTSDTTDREVGEPNQTKNNTRFNGGLETFYKHIVEEECTTTEPIIPMKTKVNLNSKHELLVDPKDSYVMMIPGLGGEYNVFSSLSERLKKPAITLQLDPTLRGTIPELAKNLYHFVKQRFYLESPFYLMGYSFGVNVALELAAILEKEGLVGVVYCLDSSPDALRTHFNAYLGDLSDEQLQNSLLEHFYRLLSGHEPKDIKDILEKTTKWSDKIEVFIKTVKNYTQHTHEFIRNLVQIAYDRIKMAKEYKPALKLESELVLLKGVPHPHAKQLSDDYNLSKYTNKPVQIFEIESDHAMAPLDCRVPNFMNRTFVL